LAAPEPEPPSDSGVSVESRGHLVRRSRHFDEAVLLRAMAALSDGIGFEAWLLDALP